MSHYQSAINAASIAFAAAVGAGTALFFYAWLGWVAAACLVGFYAALFLLMLSYAAGLGHPRTDA